MEKIKIRVSGSQIEVVESPAVITSGTVGLPVEFTFDSRWENLSKMAVFRAGDRVITLAMEKNALTVPWEVLEKPNLWLGIGVYGANAAGSVVIPTLWAEVTVVHTGVDPEGDPGLEPTAPAWQEIIARLDNVTLENLGGASFDYVERELSEVQIAVVRADTLAKDNEILLDEHTANQENPHGVTAEQIGAASFDYVERGLSEVQIAVVRADTLAKDNEILLDEHTANQENPHGVTAEQVGAAPAGYGLGESSASAQAWNGAARNGFYRSNTHSPDGEWWYGINCKYDSNIAAQIAFKRVSDAGDPMVMAIRHRPTYQSANPWLEWEYANPPMEPGVEYRTTERWNGKAVYKKLVGDVICQRLDGETEWQEVPSPKTIVDRWYISDYADIIYKFPEADFYWYKYLDGTAKVFYMGLFSTVVSNNYEIDEEFTISLPFPLMDVSINVDNYVEDERSAVFCRPEYRVPNEASDFNVQVRFNNSDASDLTGLDAIADFTVTITGRWK